ncbi:MAG: TIR domain-containing protein [Williamsia sp.]|nr:TIR domain-containing protein [Williamsia sp.]
MESIKYFLSYSRQNIQFVRKLAADLNQAGIQVWLDQADIAPGSRWDDSIEHALKDATGLLIVLSEASVKSQNVMDEVSYAIEQHKRVVPVMIEDCVPPFRLARFQYIDFRNDYEVAFQQLLKTLQAPPGADNKDQPPAGTIPSGNPFPKKTAVKKQEDHWPANQPKEDAGRSPFATHANKLTGILFIALAVLIAVFNKCPTKVLYFIMYALIGLGIALLLTKSAEKVAASFKLWNIKVVLAGAIVLPFVLFFTNPIGAFKPDSCELPLSVTVFVHGSKGRQDMILRQQGYVVMDLKGGERKTASINENGAAYFQNLHEGDSVRLEIDFSEPYKTIHPDSVYVIANDSRVYLPVALQGINKVEGIVLYKDAPLPGVMVKIGQLTATTNPMGDFTIPIPASLQKKEYKVWFFKDGFKTKSAPAFPQTGQPLEVVMEK